MNLHEYQAKALLKQYQLPVPQGKVVHSKEEAAALVETLPEQSWVVKAQVHAGGRGKSGGIQRVKGKQPLLEAIQAMLGTRLVTYQTDAQGQPVNQVLIEEACEIAKELYLSLVVDRKAAQVAVMMSTEGGMDIEQVATHSPEKILTVLVNPLLGLLPYQSRTLAFQLGLSSGQRKQLEWMLETITRMFVECDLALLEINPLVLTTQGELLCLDAKIHIDDNALYRQPQLQACYDRSQEDERVNHAKDWDLNYIPLTGNIGCMVNGAGLAMATMDMIKLYGGSPANFLDVGGSATTERVTEAFKIIVADPEVKGILVNIFGGIVRCDLIADGIIAAAAKVAIKIPVVVRLEGNQADLGAKKMRESGLNLIAAENLEHAAKRMVEVVGDKG